jgi:CubicO group peptidase (beta-lactamase class C family)
MKKTLGVVAKLLGGVVLVLVLVVVGYVLLRPKPPQPPEAVASLGEAEAYLDELVESGTPPGLSLVVVKDGVIVYSRAFGLADGPNNIPATPETVYRFWSVTKISTAIAILQLHEGNLLNIDDPVADYLPFFDIVYPSDNSETITIRHLLNHSSGLPDNMPEVMGWMHTEEEDEPRLDQVAFLEEAFPDYQELIFEPGDHAEYTNVGYMVLGAVVEVVSGQIYEDYVVEHIYQPLGMNHTNFVYTDEMLPYAAVGSHPRISFESFILPFLYENWGEFIREKTGGKMWFNRLYPHSDPPTGMVSTTTDLARLMLAYLNNGELDGAHVLSPETIEMMTYDSHVVGVDNGNVDRPFFGLGWGIFPEGGRLYLDHGGGGPGFGTEVRIYPEESLGLAVVANDTTYDPELILDLFASLDW